MSAKMERCPCCGDTKEMAAFAVCRECAALLGWDPACPACIAEQKDSDEFLPADEHIATCRVGIGLANLRRAAGRRAARVTASAADARVDVVMPDGSHTYWSTHCRHGNHEACSAPEVSGPMPGGLGHYAAIERKPAQCKTCAAPCICPCHREGS